MGRAKLADAAAIFLRDAVRESISVLLDPRLQHRTDSRKNISAMHRYHMTCEAALRKSNASGTFFGSILIHLVCRPGNDAALIGTLDQLDGSLEIHLPGKVGTLLSILYELHL